MGVKKKNALVLILIICAFIACKKSPEKIISGYEKSDTIFLMDKEILFISPSDKNIENLKKKYGDDFYTIADDAHTYFSDASTYLDSLKISYKNYNDDRIIGFKINNKFIEIPKYKNPWYLIFFQNGKYKMLDLVNIREEYVKFFNDGNLAKSTNLDSKKIIDSIAGNQYFRVEEKDCDLNNDSFQDKIIILGNNHDINPQDPSTKIAPIIILLNEKNEKYKVLINNRIYPNDFGDAFSRLVIKNEYFTIELKNTIPDNYDSEKYITFKYDAVTKKINLYKYSEDINWHDGSKSSIRCSKERLGSIYFDQFNSNSINEKCK